MELGSPYPSLQLTRASRGAALRLRSSSLTSPAASERPPPFWALVSEFLLETLPPSFPLSSLKGRSPFPFCSVYLWFTAACKSWTAIPLWAPNKHGFALITFVAQFFKFTIQKFVINCDIKQSLCFELQPSKLTLLYSLCYWRVIAGDGCRSVWPLFPFDLKDVISFLVNPWNLMVHRQYP